MTMASLSFITERVLTRRATRLRRTMNRLSEGSLSIIPGHVDGAQKED